MLLLEELFRDHPGSLARERCRDEVFARDEDESVRDLVYGEFGFMSLVAFFETHRARIPREGAKLVDLGAGVGRPAFAAATLHPFESCVGIECLRGLHALGAELVSLYDAECAPAIAAAMRAHAVASGTLPMDDDDDEDGGGGARAPRVRMIRGDFLDDDGWGDADVMLINSCCFSEQLFAKIEARAMELLRPGALAVTLRQRFVDVTNPDDKTEGAVGECWTLLEARERRMSWGPSMMYVYARTDAPAPPYEYIRFPKSPKREAAAANGEAASRSPLSSPLKSPPKSPPASPAVARLQRKLEASSSDDEEKTVANVKAMNKLTVDDVVASDSD